MFGLNVSRKALHIVRLLFFFLFFSSSSLMRFCRVRLGWNLWTYRSGAGHRCRFWDAGCTLPGWRHLQVAWGIWEDVVFESAVKKKRYRSWVWFVFNSEFFFVWFNNATYTFSKIQLATQQKIPNYHLWQTMYDFKKIVFFISCFSFFLQALPLTIMVVRRNEKNIRKSGSWTVVRTYGPPCLGNSSFDSSNTAL